jgi:hypothetical protein
MFFAEALPVLFPIVSVATAHDTDPSRNLFGTILVAANRPLPIIPEPTFMLIAVHTR